MEVQQDPNEHSFTKVKERMNRIAPEHREEVALACIAAALRIMERKQIESFQQAVTSEFVPCTCGRCWSDQLLNVIDGELAIRDLRLA